MKKKLGWFIPITLGMLTAFGPFVTDFYLPVMPEMAQYFHTSPALVAMSLTTGMLGLALGQILIGPLSDKYGRKRLLVLSMALFAVSSICCIFAPGIFLFNVLRFFQGLGGAGGIVLSKSIATDMFSGNKLQSFMAVMGAINGIAPVFAPVIGGSLAGFTSWQGIFCLLLAVGVILLVCSCRLRETLKPHKRFKGRVTTTYVNLFRVFRNNRFSLSTLSMMFCFFAFFAYIASSPFILQEVYGLSPFLFSLCFGLNALMIGVGSGLCTLFHHQNTALKCGAVDFMIAAVLVAFCLVARMPLILLMGSYIYLLLSFGLMQPATTAIALDSERGNAGAASAIFGASGFLAGAAASPLVSMGNLLYSSAAVIASGALVCLIVTLRLCEQVKQEGMGKREKA